MGEAAFFIGCGNAGGYSYMLRVNGSSVSGTGDNLDGVMYISGLDKKDKLKEIAITESGPSVDYATAFYFYNGSKQAISWSVSPIGIIK